MEDPEIEVIGVFPAKSSIKKMIQDSFKKTYEQAETDDIVILEPACTTVPSKKSQPIPKIKLRKLASGEDVWDFGQTSAPSVVTPLPSSRTTVAKSKFSFPTFKKEQGEYVEVKVPPPPEITLSYQDCGSKSHPCVDNKLNNRRPGNNCEDFEVIEVLPSRSNKKRK